MRNSKLFTQPMRIKEFCMADERNVSDIPDAGGAVSQFLIPVCKSSQLFYNLIEPQQAFIWLVAADDV